MVVGVEVVGVVLTVVVGDDVPVVVAVDDTDVEGVVVGVAVTVEVPVEVADVVGVDVAVVVVGVVVWEVVAVVRVVAVVVGVVKHGNGSDVMATANRLASICTTPSLPHPRSPTMPWTVGDRTASSNGSFFLSKVDTC